MAGIPKTKRSGGPKTETGKAVASQNSLKTGLYSNTVVLPGEDESEYQQIENQFIKDFSPQDIAELTMVRELAVVVWKKHRLERLELSASMKVLSDEIEDYEYRQHGLSIKSTASYWIENIEYLTEEVVAENKEILVSASKFVGRELQVLDIERMIKEHLYLYNNIIEQGQNLNLFKEETISVEELAEIHVTDEKNKSLQFICYAIRVAIFSAENILWTHEHADQIKAATQSIKAQRLLNVMELEKPRRVNDDLSRIFFRTLSELRKHQQWRQARNTVDVTPKSIKNNA